MIVWVILSQVLYMYVVLDTGVGVSVGDLNSGVGLIINVRQQKVSACMENHGI